MRLTIFFQALVAASIFDASIALSYFPSFASPANEVHYLSITNLAYDQPFSPFFVMVHSPDVDPLYEMGQQASPELAALAENGDPAPLVSLYENQNGVFSAISYSTDAPYFLGDSTTIRVEVPNGYLVTIASMAINTNDAIVAINGQLLQPGHQLNLPALDAGTEENNERCNSIPGPACADISGDNVADGNGEGVVHVHRGIYGNRKEGKGQGAGSDLIAEEHDWRNPMLRVVVRNRS